MAALDDQHEIARGGLVARGDVQVDAELFTDHAFGVEHVAGGVERKGGRQRMQNGSARIGVRGRRCFENAMDIVLGHGLASQSRLGVEALRGQKAAGHVDDDAADLDARHALGRIDRQPHRMLRGLKVDDGAAFDAARTLMPDAEHLAAMGAATQRLRRLHRRQPRDQADDLRRADVENRKNGALAGRNLPHARRKRPESSWLGRLLRRVRIRPGGRRLLRQPHEHAARHAEIERQNVALEDPLTRAGGGVASQSPLADPTSGSLMSTPDFSFKFHRRWSTSTPASTRGLSSSIASTRATNSRIRWFAPSPTTNGRSTYRPSCASSIAAPSAAIARTCPSFCQRP